MVFGFLEQTESTAALDTLSCQARTNTGLTLERGMPGSPPVSHSIDVLVQVGAIIEQIPAGTAWPAPPVSSVPDRLQDESTHRLSPGSHLSRSIDTMVDRLVLTAERVAVIEHLGVALAAIEDGRGGLIRPLPWTPAQLTQAGELRRQVSWRHSPCSTISV